MTADSDFKCKHEAGFTFHRGTKYPGIWLCVHTCGFFLNFNPETFPNGVAYTLEPKGPNRVIKISHGQGKY